MSLRTMPRRLVIAVPTRSELDAALDAAHNILKPLATTERVGILVTRLAPGRYEARLHSELPAGTTRERWEPLH